MERLNAECDQPQGGKHAPGEEAADATAEGIAESLSVSSGDCESIDYEALQQELGDDAFSAKGKSSGQSLLNDEKRDDEAATSLVADLEDFDVLLAETKEILMKQKAKQLALNALAHPSLVERHDSEEDFVLNFLVTHGMQRTLDMFQVEWYQNKLVGETDSPTGEATNPQTVPSIPPVFTLNEKLREQIDFLKKEVQECKEVAAKKSACFDHYKKERDFHRMHHRRVKREKDAAGDGPDKFSALNASAAVKRLQAELQVMQETIDELKKKNEAAVRSKALLALERDKLQSRVHALEARLAIHAEGASDSSRECEDEKRAHESQRQENDGQKKTGRHALAGKAVGMEKSYETTIDNDAQGRKSCQLYSQWPAKRRTNPYCNTAPCARVTPSNLQPIMSVEAHAAPVTSLCFHPTLPLLATASDDCTWKLWQLPGGKLVMSAKGHTDWVGCVTFHPLGSLLVSTSGDCTAKVWSITKEKCLHTFCDHTLPVWACSVHYQGDFFATGGQDHTVKCYDLNSLRCCQTLRGHTSSVNSVCFQPYTNQLASASADTTVALWDMRTCKIIHTFRCHESNCNRVVFNAQGNMLASCDSGGVVVVHDMRKMKPWMHLDFGPAPCNAVAFDTSACTLAIASADCTVKFADVKDSQFTCDLQHHTDYVQDVTFDPRSETVATASSDKSFVLWGEASNTPVADAPVVPTWPQAAIVPAS